MNISNKEILMYGQLFDFLKVIDFDAEKDELLEYNSYFDLINDTNDNLGCFYLKNNKLFMEITYVNHILIKINNPIVTNIIRNMVAIGYSTFIKDNNVLEIINYLEGSISNLNSLFREFFTRTNTPFLRHKNNLYSKRCAYYYNLKDNYKKDYNNFLNKDYPDWYKKYLILKSI